MTESEMKYWSQLTVDFMTEESDDGGDKFFGCTSVAVAIKE